MIVLSEFQSSWSSWSDAERQGWLDSVDAAVIAATTCAERHGEAPSRAGGES